MLQDYPLLQVTQRSKTSVRSLHPEVSALVSTHGKVNDARQMMPFLVEILLPQLDRKGAEFDKSSFERVQQELTEKFGGVTAFLRSSAQGLWRTADDDVVRDSIAVLEVMVDQVDAPWWNDYRQKLECCFRQDEVVIRATEIRRL